MAENDEVDTTATTETAEAPPPAVPPPVPFEEPPPRQNPPPTAEQIAWMRNNPDYVRTSHTRGLFKSRGTLTADGTHVPEGPGQPVLDGNGMFGVGIPKR